MMMPVSEESPFSLILRKANGLAHAVALRTLLYNPFSAAPLPRDRPERPRTMARTARAS